MPPVYASKSSNDNNIVLIAGMTQDKNLLRPTPNSEQMMQCHRKIVFL